MSNSEPEQKGPEKPKRERKPKEPAAIVVAAPAKHPPKPNYHA